jgi:hypothetical protein
MQMANCHVLQKLCTVTKNKWSGTLMASFCHMIDGCSNVSHRVRTNRDGRYSNILHTAQTYHHNIFTCWAINETPWRQYVHIQWWYAGDCGIVVWAASQGILDSWDMPTCVCVCVCVCVRVCIRACACVCVCVWLSKCLWWFFSHIH